MIMMIGKLLMSNLALCENLGCAALIIPKAEIKSLDNVRPVWAGLKVYLV